jgi:hypothetical protein
MSRTHLFGIFAMVISIALLGAKVFAGNPASPANLLAESKTISGVVLDASGAPAANVPVKLYAVKPKSSGPAVRPPGAGPTGDSAIGTPRPIALQRPGDTLVTQTTTDAAGKFKFDAVQSGPYLVVAGSGSDIVRRNLEVNDKEELKPLTLKLPRK